MFTATMLTLNIKDKPVAKCDAAMPYLNFDCVFASNNTPMLYEPKRAMLKNKIHRTPVSVQ